MTSATTATEFADLQRELRTFSPRAQALLGPLVDEVPQAARRTGWAWRRYLCRLVWAGVTAAWAEAWS